MLMTMRLPNSPVVKRGDFSHENKRSREALSPPPPVYVRIGESGALAKARSCAVSIMCTSVYVHAVMCRCAGTFTTSALALLKARRNRKPWGSKELHSVRSPTVKKQVVKALRHRRLRCRHDSLCRGLFHKPWFHSFWNMFARGHSRHDVCK